MPYKYYSWALFFVVFLVWNVALAGEKVSPLEVSGATTITHQKVKILFDSGAKFVDTRKDSDWDAGRIPRAIHLELENKLSKESLAEHVLLDEDIVFYCNGPKCMRSSKASKMAVEWGYKYVYYYRNGFPDWDKHGYPIE